MHDTNKAKRSAVRSSRSHQAATIVAMPALDPASMLMTTTSQCCAETVNSAISLWTELEVLDDDEDLYTYQTLDTASQMQMQQRTQVHHHTQHCASGTMPVRGCLRNPTILPNAAEVVDVPMMLTHGAVDPQVQWQEEAYWMSFQNAVRSFSDHQASRASSSYTTSASAAAATTRRTANVAERIGSHHSNPVREGDDDDTDMSSFQYLHPHVVTNDNDHDDEDDDEDVDDDGIPPCIPRTVVTPTASLGSASMKMGSRHSHSNNSGHGHGHGHGRGSMSIATSSSASSSSATNPKKVLPSFAANPDSAVHPEPHPKPAPAPSSPERPNNGEEEDGQFGEIRRSLRELMAQAAINKKMNQDCPGSPMTAATTTANSPGAAPAVLTRRGDPGYIISTSLAGPTLEEIKGLRWRMKELAEHAAVVAKGEKDAEKYVIGLASANNSTL
jgi:hypothetical protein